MRKKEELARREEVGEDEFIGPAGNGQSTGQALLHSYPSGRSNQGRGTRVQASRGQDQQTPGQGRGGERNRPIGSRETSTQERSAEKEKGGGRDKRAERQQEITGKAFAASGRTFPNGQGIEDLTDTPKSDSSESHLSEDGPPGLLPVDLVEADSEEELGITPG